MFRSVPGHSELGFNGIMQISIRISVFTVSVLKADGAQARDLRAKAQDLRAATEISEMKPSTSDLKLRILEP